MDIATGQSEDHPSLLPLAPDPAPPVQGLVAPVPAIGDHSPMVVGVFDAAADQADRLSGYAYDIAAAQHAGMSAENDRRSGYHADMLPVGADYGQLMSLPAVP